MPILTNLIYLVVLLAIAPIIHYKTTNVNHILLKLTLGIQHIQYTYITPIHHSNTTSHYIFQQFLKNNQGTDPLNVTDPTSVVAEQRAGFPFGTLIPLPIYGCTVHKHTYNIDSQLYTTYYVYGNRNIQHWEQNKNQEILLYLHGGALIYGDINAYRGVECELSDRLNMPVVHIEYSRAPGRSLIAQQIYVLCYIVSLY